MRASRTRVERQMGVVVGTEIPSPLGCREEFHSDRVARGSGPVPSWEIKAPQKSDQV